MGREDAGLRAAQLRVLVRITPPGVGLYYLLTCGHGMTDHHIAAAAVEMSTGAEKVCQLARAHREQTRCVCQAEDEALDAD